MVSAIWQDAASVQLHRRTQFTSTPTERSMLPQTMVLESDPHTARKGEIQRPVLLLCFMIGPGARPLAPSHTRSVLSRDVVSTRCEPAAEILAREVPGKRVTDMQ